MKNVDRLIILVLVSLCATISSAQTNLQKGIVFFEQRAENHNNLKVDSANINQAISFLRQAYSDNESNEQACSYLLRAYYYKGAFVVKTKQEQKTNYLIGQTLGEQVIEKYPQNAAILLWYIANMSKYGEAQGVVTSAKNGLADKVKKYAEKLLELDSEFNDGAAYKLLGVINYKVPYIPLFLTWPDKKVAEEYLKKALAINPKAISNLYYYAEFLTEVKRNEEAKIILNKIINASPREEALIEDLYDIDMAKKLIEKIK
jgi:tetratricopeptide (TPR) repeat protein